MQNIKIDFTKTNGIMKPMHAVNNGPTGSKVRQGNSTYSYFKEAGIPYARNHDASFYSGYGGEYTVDVHRIFRNFDADPTDPASYDFECTDQYIADTASVGTETFYRLGSCIEHGKKVGTFPPKDFYKWAVICEHIIRHYNEGWADGFHYNITYWEIWNEPDCHNADGSNPCWQGTAEQFVEFYCIAQKHLKECFPHLKIGGPAFSSLNVAREPKKRFLELFFSTLREQKIPLDFFSFHRYAKEPYEFGSPIEVAQQYCRKYGYEDTELILNEWNYVRGWLNEEWNYTIRAEKGLKGASFIAGVMAYCQDSALDMLMYYDARPCGMNGMFDTDFLTPLKGYYPFKMFGELYRMGRFVRPEYEGVPLYCTAAGNDAAAGVMLTNFAEDDTAPAQTVTLQMKGIAGKTAEIYLLDETHDMELVETKPAAEEMVLEIPLYSTYFVKMV